MNTLWLSSLLLGLTAVGLASVVPFFASKPQHKIWVYFCLLVGWWGFGLTMLSVAGPNMDAARFWWKVITLPGMFIPSVFFHFAARLTQRNISKAALAIAYLQAAVFWILFFIGRIGYGLKFMNGEYYYVQIASTSYGLLFITWVGYGIAGHVLLFLGLRTADPEKRIQIKYVLLAMIVAFGFGSLFHWLSVFGIGAPPALNLLLVTFLLLTSYSIFRDQLLFMDAKVRKSIVYTAIVSVFSAAYFLALYLFESRFLKERIGYDSFALTFIGLAIVIFCAEPLRLTLNGLLDRYFYRGNLAQLEEEKELLSDEVAKQDKMKSIAAFAAGMAHEIKNPLASIKTFAEYLPRRFDDQDFRDKFTRIVPAEVERINRTVKSLLEFSKPKDLAFRSIVPSDIAEEVLDLLSNDLIRARIEIVRNFELRRVINADADSIKQLILNLMVNAMEAMPNGGKIDVGTKDSHGKTLFYVRDYGAGVQVDSIERIFDPFVTTKTSGTGLGLWICRSIVERHGGKIQAQNAEPGLRINVWL